MALSVIVKGMPKSVILVLNPDGTVSATEVALPPTERKIVKPPAKNRQTPPEHGTYGRYIAPHNCRCDDCRAANNAQVRLLRQTMRQRLGEDHIPHGTYYAYIRYRCRCVPCIEANRAYDKVKRERRKELGIKRVRSDKPLTPEQRARRNELARLRRQKRKAER